MKFKFYEREWIGRRPFHFARYHTNSNHVINVGAFGLGLQVTF